MKKATNLSTDGFSIIGGVDGTSPGPLVSVDSTTDFENAVLLDGTVTCVAGQTSPFR